MREEIRKTIKSFLVKSKQKKVVFFWYWLILKNRMSIRVTVPVVFHYSTRLVFFFLFRWFPFSLTWHSKYFHLEFQRKGSFVMIIVWCVLVFMWEAGQEGDGLVHRRQQHHLARRQQYQARGLHNPNAFASSDNRRSSLCLCAPSGGCERVHRRWRALSTLQYYWIRYVHGHFFQLVYFSLSPFSHLTSIRNWHNNKNNHNRKKQDKKQGQKWEQKWQKKSMVEHVSLSLAVSLPFHCKNL